VVQYLCTASCEERAHVVLYCSSECSAVLLRRDFQRETGAILGVLQLSDSTHLDWIPAVGLESNSIERCSTPARFPAKNGRKFWRDPDVRQHASRLDSDSRIGIQVYRTQDSLFARRRPVEMMADASRSEVENVQHIRL
jgi:hypothetical protein